MDRERIIQVFFFGFLALIAYELYVVIAPFFTPIVWAILLAFVAHPALLELDRLVRRRTLSAVILTFAIALGVILPAVWLSGRLANEAQTLYGQVSDLMADGGLNKARDWAVHSELIAAINRHLAPRGIKVEDEVPKYAMQAAQVTSEYIARNLTNAARNVVGVVIDFGLILLVFFYLLRDGERYYSQLRALTPLHEDDKAAIFETLRTTLSSVMRGLMVTSIVQGVTIGLGMLIFGVPYWAFLSIISAIAGLTPFGGTALVWLPAAAYLYFASGWSVAIGFVVWCSISIAVIDNFIKPIVMRHGTRLPTLAVFFGIAGGLEAYGPLGLFLGPAIISVFAALLQVYMKTYGDTRRKAA